jgi:hypothetical protein
MVLPSVGKCTNVIYIDFCIFDIVENVVHGLLGKHLCPMGNMCATLAEGMHKSGFEEKN